MADAPRRLAQLEQPWLGALLQLSDEGLIAETPVTSDQGGSPLGREFVQHAHQAQAHFDRTLTSRLLCALGLLSLNGQRPTQESHATVAAKNAAKKSTVHSAWRWHRRH